jgi:outer membrane receptor protein involved in Fe transport
MRSGGERLGGYAIHSASLRLSRDQWSAALYADNLTDKYASTSVRLDPSAVFDSGDFAVRRYYRNVLRPRTIGLEFRYLLGE